MFVLRALHSFVARLGDRKLDKSLLQPELARAANDFKTSEAVDSITQTTNPSGKSDSEMMVKC